MPRGRYYHDNKQLWLDGSRMRANMSRHRLYQLALLDPCLCCGTDYNCEATHLRSLCVRPSSSNASKPKTPEQAVSELKGFLDLGRAPGIPEMAAIARLSRALGSKRWAPDIAVKAFPDIDTIFFRGALLGHVNVYWIAGNRIRARSRNQNGYLGVTEQMAKGRATIGLNADTIILSGTRDVFKTMCSVLIHQMIHAYLTVACGSMPPPTQYDVTKGPAWEDGHG
ncbi:MAG: hypothetical protein Q9214_007027, partial [Letrouitia sp. 1 TL-2023]